MKKTLPKTHWKKLYNPDYLGAWSIEEGGELILTISDVQVKGIKVQDGKEQECTVISWKENQKPMVLNRTNGKTITKVANSPYIEDWIGLRIILFATKVKAFGDLVEAIRVRAKVPKAKEKFTPFHAGWLTAKKSLKDGNVTIEAIRKKYELTDEHAKLLIDADPS